MNAATPLGPRGRSAMSLAKLTLSHVMSSTQLKYRIEFGTLQNLLISQAVAAKTEGDIDVNKSARVHGHMFPRAPRNIPASS